ncbi:hypothetical protein [Paramagnetospirillum magnetotacticum]|nr:hypothetical protein [Paramagnetospirillum magnetotacticum]
MAILTTLLEPKTDIWHGRIRPDIAFMDSLIPEAGREKDRGPNFQIVRSKDGKGNFSQNAVYGSKGCIAAVLAAFQRQTGEALTINGLADRIAALSGPNAKTSAVDKTLRRLEDGHIVTWETTLTISNPLGIDPLDLVRTLLNNKGVEIDRDRMEQDRHRLSNFVLPMCTIDSSIDAITWLEFSLRKARRLDLDDANFVPADMDNCQAANRAYDLVRSALRAWHRSGADGSIERGRLSQALQELAAAGMYLHCGRLARLVPLGEPDDSDARSETALVARFSPKPTAVSIPWSRENELGLSIDDDGLREDAVEALAWAAQERF